MKSTWVTPIFAICILLNSINGYFLRSDLTELQNIVKMLVEAQKERLTYEMKKEKHSNGGQQKASMGNAEGTGLRSSGAQ